MVAQPLMTLKKQKKHRPGPVFYQARGGAFFKIVRKPAIFSGFRQKARTIISILIVSK